MIYHLSRRAVLKWLEKPCVYHLGKDEIYELDKESFRFLKECITTHGCSAKDSAFIDYCLEEGLLTTESVPVKHPVLIEGPKPSLRYLEVNITDACNLNCKHCSIEPGGNELSSSRVYSLLDSFEKMQGLRAAITGGEPLLHSKFDEINEMLSDFFIRKVLFTNGLLLKKERFQSLKVDEIRTSIDGLEKAHDALRGSGTFKIAMRTVREALDAGYDVSVSTMVHRRNLGDFDALEDLFRKIGIKDWNVEVPAPTGRLKDNLEFLVTPEEGGKFLGYGFGGGLHASGEGYGCGLHMMAVLADGRMVKCSLCRDETVGSLDEGLPVVWQKMKPVPLKDLSCDCEYIDVCRGGCRYRAERIEGKGGKDLYRCMLYGIIVKKPAGKDHEGIRRKANSLI